MSFDKAICVGGETRMFIFNRFAVEREKRI